ncbi:MAG: DUF3793 family protein [Cellulosilyticum sp.]|nr:DUF3793 family protein [Cellulosilyticum sp.]
MSYWRMNQMKDKRVVFFDRIRELEDTEYLTYYLKYQLAPVIMGYKPSITLSLGRRDGRRISKIKTLKVIESLGLRGMVLRETTNTHIVLAYRKCSIEDILQQPKEREFLESLGYPLDSVYRTLSYLRKRYEYCHCPAELGTFLGFPIEDVKDYMCGTKKKCLLCGYWQVYNNRCEAEKIFKRYDDAKESMLSYLLEELLRSS